MNKRMVLMAAMLLCAGVCSKTAFAQSSGGGGGGGGTGSTGISGGITTQLASGMTTSSLGQTTGGTGSTGTTGGGGGAAGGGAGAANANGFIGGNATQTFIGGAREATNQQNSNRQFQAFQNTQIAPGTQSQQSSTPREIRTVMSVGFNFPTASEAQRSGKLANANSLSLTRYIGTRPEFSDVRVSLASDGTAVLTGVAPSIESSRLAANAIRIQPGVRKVSNQIAVNR